MNICGIEVVIKQGDITEEDTEAIVNAANNYFYMGGGVAGAIRKKGGDSIEKEAVKLGPVEIGESVITKGSNLKAKYVIHASTMGKDFKTDADKIRKSAASSLRVAQENNIKSISFCALGCGVGRFPYKDSAKIMAQEVFRYLRQPEPSLEKIVFVLRESEAFNIFEKNVKDYLEYITRKVSEGPFVTVDGIIEYQEKIVLIQRSNPPLGWAIPGGFVDYGETVEDAVIREIKEETGLDLISPQLLGVYSDPKRDPRFHTVSVVFYGKAEGLLQSGSDAEAASVFRLDDLPEDIAFDHRKVLKDYVKAKAKDE